jgi:phage shock protein A
MEANKCQKNSIDMSDVSQDSNLDTIENPIATTSGANPPLERPTWLDEVLTVIAATENRINKKIEETEDHIEVKVAATVTKDTKEMFTNLEGNLTTKWATIDQALKDQKKVSEDLKTDVEQLRGEQQSTSTKVTSLSADYKKDFAKLQDQIDEAKASTSTADYKSDIAKLQDQIDAAAASTSSATSAPPSTLTEEEAQITIDGIYETRNEDIMQKCQDRVFVHLGLNYNLTHTEQCYRLGRDDNASNTDPKKRPRTITIKFNDKSCKEMVMKRRFKLGGHKVYVDDYFSDAEVVKTRRRLHPIIRKARRNPAYKNKINLNGDKIVLNGNEIGVNEFDQLPEDIHPKNICTEKRGDVTFFFKCDSPLSNHHACSFDLWGRKFNCSEQIGRAHV